MSKKVSCRKDFTRGKGKVKMAIMDTILCGKGVVLACGLTRYFLQLSV
jgi:hypothetical protein